MEAELKNHSTATVSIFFIQLWDFLENTVYQPFLVSLCFF